MKRIVSIMLCVVLSMGNIVLAEEKSLTVLEVESFNTLVGEEIEFSLTKYNESGVAEVDKYEAVCDTDGIDVDKEAKIITADKPGIYDITFSTDDGFSKKIKLAVNDTSKEQVTGNGCY